MAGKARLFEDKINEANKPPGFKKGEKKKVCSSTSELILFVISLIYLRLGVQAAIAVAATQVTL